MKKNKDYSFKQIQEFAEGGNFEINEIGGETIGRSFIVLEHISKDCCISFILTGYSSVTGNHYTCIYSDFKQL